VSQPNKLGFEVAKLLRYRLFRDRLKACGHQSGMTIYTPLPDETGEQVKARMEPGRHLLVVEDAAQPFGLRIVVCEID
jgi:hypothetical protein